MTTTPIAEPTKSRVQKRCPCGVCGRDTAVNSDGTYRVHGVPEDRCEATGLAIKARVFPVQESGTVAVYGTCGICGITQKDPREVESPKLFLKTHNHNRPRVSQEGDASVVTWFRYRTFQWRRRYFDWHDMAMDFAADIKEHTW